MLGVLSDAYKGSNHTITPPFSLSFNNTQAPNHHHLPNALTNMAPPTKRQRLAKPHTPIIKPREWMFGKSQPRTSANPAIAWTYAHLTAPALRPTLPYRDYPEGPVVFSLE